MGDGAVIETVPESLLSGFGFITTDHPYCSNVSNVTLASSSEVMISYPMSIVSPADISIRPSVFNCRYSAGPSLDLAIVMVVPSFRMKYT